MATQLVSDDASQRYSTPHRCLIKDNRIPHIAHTHVSFCDFYDTLKIGPDLASKLSQIIIKAGADILAYQEALKQNENPTNNPGVYRKLTLHEIDLFYEAIAEDQLIVSAATRLLNDRIPPNYYPSDKDDKKTT